MNAYHESAAPAPEVNVDELERAASMAAGAWLAWKGIGRDSMLGLGLLGLGGYLVYRGLTGHCDLYDALGTSTAYPSDDELEDEDLGDLELDARRLEHEDDLVDEASEESFPASDPPSFTPGGSTEPEQL